MKHIKGHTQILLTDVKTGKVEKIESDNLVTNAVKEFLSFWQPLFGWSAMSDYFLPLWQKMFGGLYLFDNALLEDVNNTFLPNAADAKLTGYAGNGTSGGEDTKRGSFNANESEALSNGYKFVWDFGTSEANGTIAAACLTNPLAGYHGYNYDPWGCLLASNAYTGNTQGNYKGMGWTVYGSNDALDQKPYPYFYIVNGASANKYRYEFIVDNNHIKQKAASQQNGSTTVYSETEIKLNSLNLTGKFGTREYNTESVSNNVARYGENAFSFSDNDYIYIAITNLTSIYINKYAKSSKLIIGTVTVDVYSQINKNIRVSPINERWSTAGMAFRNGYLYFIVHDPNDNYKQGYVAKADIATGVVTVLTPKFSLTQSSGGECRALVYKDNNDNIIAGGFLIDRNDDYIPIEVAWNGEYNVQILVSKYACNFASYYYSPSLMPNLQYLATINNLATPVIKTASKTMKVTYTLTEAT